MEKDNLILSELGQMMKAVFSVLKVRFREQIPTYLTHEQANLLHILGEKDTEVIQKDLAEFMCKDKSSILRLTDSLEEKGLVRKAVEKKDRRKNYLMITKQGISVMDQYKVVANKLIDELQKDISESDLRTFLKVISQLKDNAKKLSVNN